ncbi:MAG: endonuclease NucS [Desulfurococcaceae archaeon]
MPLETCSNISLEELVSMLKSAIARRSLVVVFGECRVDYEGRAASRLEPGERVVIIKRDGALLVHRPDGYSPVNWQPSTATIEVAFKPGIGLLIHAVRDRPREYLTIVFTRVDLVVVGDLVDQGEFTMYLEERDMRDVLVENPWLIEDGLRILEVEKPVGDGYVDIYALDASGRHVLVELKRVTATREAALQLYKYVEAYKKERGETPRGILVAPSFAPTALETLAKLKLEYRYVDLKKLWELLKKKSSRRTSLQEFLKK